MLSSESKSAIQSGGDFIFFMIFRSCLLLCENHVVNFKLISFQISRLHSVATFSPLLFQEILLLPACKFCKTEPSDHFAGSKVQKWALWSFWGLSHDLLGHLDRRPSLSEPLEPLESVVYENPVLVRLTGIVIWRGGWKRKVKVIFKTGEFWEISKERMSKQGNHFYLQTRLER